jgi:3-hydroxymyristoyl/3-hydroxydecanoyl-(acyl carrier protein) dehydratase
LNQATPPDEHGVVVRIPADHSCLPGHFPGRPIVPAVLLLDEVRMAVDATFPASSIDAVEHAKFQGLVLPDRPFRIILKRVSEMAIDFTCVDAGDDRQLATGRLTLNAPEAS